MALAARIQRRSYNVYVLLHDREFLENSAGEAALLATQLNLGNLTAIVEYHSQQTPGQRSMAANSPASKWQALGWATREVDGHDLSAIAKALRAQRSASTPIAILARTIAGRGVSFVEADKYEPRAPSDEEVESTRKELGL
jgi:transketolase